MRKEKREKRKEKENEKEKEVKKQTHMKMRKKRRKENKAVYTIHDIISIWVGSDAVFGKCFSSMAD